MKTQVGALLGVWLAVSPALEAAAGSLPPGFLFQGKLVDKDTKEPMNGSYNMSFKIYDAPSGGNQLYSEGPFAVPVDNGVFSVVVGESVPLSSDVFVGGDAYLGLTVAPDSEMTPRHRLVFSPYAYTAAQLSTPADVRVIAGAVASTFTSTGNLVIPYGVNAATAVLTGTGNTQYSLQTSSGINILAGTLSVAGAVIASLFKGDGAQITNLTITPGAIDSDKLASDSVRTTHIFDGAVVTAKIGPGAVVTGKINADAVTAAAILDASIVTSKISPGAVVTGKINADAVTTAAILDDAVVTTKIREGAVVTATISNDAVTAEKIERFAAYRLLGATTLGAGATTVTVTFPPREGLLIRIYIPGFQTTNRIPQIQFNGDTGANYALARLTGATATTATAATNLALFSANQVNTNAYRAIFEVGGNSATAQKGGTYRAVVNIGSATAPTNVSGTWTWNNTTAQITSVTLLLSGTGNLNAGTSVSVYGADVP